MHRIGRQIPLPELFGYPITLILLVEMDLVFSKVLSKNPSTTQIISYGLLRLLSTVSSW